MNPPPCIAPLRLALSAEPTAAFHVRTRLRSWLDDYRWPGDPRDDLVLVVNELVTNTVEHAYPPPQRRGSVYVTATVRPAGHDLRQVQIEVVDHGCWRLTAARSNGYGLPLVTALMDDLVIITDTAGTQIVTNSARVPTAPVTPTTAPPPRRVRDEAIPPLRTTAATDDRRRSHGHPPDRRERRHLMCTGNGRPDPTPPTPRPVNPRPGS